MQRGEQKLRHLGGGHGRADGLLIAHLAEQDDVRRLAHRATQRLGVGSDIGGNLALGDDAALVTMHVLDGVFHGDDVPRARLVQLVDDAGKRRGLAGACRTGDQHEALLEVGAGHDVVGDVVVGGVGQREGDDANDGAQRPALAEHVHTEAPHARHGEGEVVVMVVAVHEDLLVAAGQLVDGVHQLLSIGGHERRHVHAPLTAVGGVGQRQARDDEDIRGLLVDHLLQQCLQFHRSSPYLSSRATGSRLCRRRSIPL